MPSARRRSAYALVSASQASRESTIVRFLDMLVHRGGAVSASTVGDRHGATFSVEENVESAAGAVALGQDVFTRLAEKAGLPHWPVVRAEALTFDELDLSSRRRTFPNWSDRGHPRGHAPARIGTREDACFSGRGRNTCFRRGLDPASLNRFVGDGRAKAAGYQSSPRELNKERNARPRELRRVR